MIPSIEYRWTELHADFTSRVIDFLNSSNIRYFILRNFEKLPEENIGKDIDIVIEPGKYKETLSGIKKIMHELNIHYLQISKFGNMHCLYIMDPNLDFGIHIDIIENEEYKGYVFFSFDELYKGTVKYKNLIVLNNPMDILMLIIQNLVAYGKLKEKYRIKISLYYPLYKESIDEQIRNFWNNELAEYIIKVLDAQNYDALESQVGWIRKDTKRKIFRSKPFATSTKFIKFCGDRFNRIVVCPNKLQRLIAVVAPDGTGKSTFIDALIVKLSELYVSDPKRFAVHHFRPTILPNLGEIVQKSGGAKQDTDFTNPHRAKQAGKLSSFIRMTYYWLDYVIGVPLLTRKEVHYERFSIYDRYIYDFLVDPKRSRIDLPEWLRRTFTRMVKQPQILFVLQADPDIIYKRKQELELPEIKRQLGEYKKLENLKNVHFIDANQPVDKMVDDAVKIILDKFLIKL